MAAARYKDLCIDAVDPARVGAFYAAAFGLQLHVDDDGDARLHRGHRAGDGVDCAFTPSGASVK